MARDEKGSQGAPEGQQGHHHVPDPDESFATRLRSTQTLAIVGVVSGLVSLVVGGVVLSAIGAISAAIALAKSRRLSAAPEAAESQATCAVVRRQAVVGLAISLVALVANAVWLAMTLPAAMEAIQSGDYAQLLGQGQGNVTDGGSEGGSSAWG